jgi:predicted hydrocarbon binding protein
MKEQIVRATDDNGSGKRVDIANALSIIRPQLGDRAGVALYRLLRLVALEDIIGRGAGATAYVAGKKLGQNLGITKLEDFLALCQAISIGVVQVPVITASRIYVDVYECVTCAGMQPVGRTLCQFEAGLVAGVIQVITGKVTKAKEMTCIGGLGHDSCGVEILM